MQSVKKVDLRVANTSFNEYQKMVNRCVATGCSNTPSDHVSMFKFPKDRVLRAQWEKQVQRTRAQWKATENSFLCSDHFTEDSFEVDSALASSFGIKKRRQLKPGAVPSIFKRLAVEPGVEAQRRSPCKRAAVSTADASASTYKRRRSAVEKRERQAV